MSQFSTGLIPSKFWTALYTGITKIKELSYLASFPAYFKYECSPEWAQGKDITVEQVAMFWEGIFIAGKSERDTLGHFVEKWKDIF